MLAMTVASERYYVWMLANNQGIGNGACFACLNEL